MTKKIEKVNQMYCREQTDLIQFKQKFFEFGQIKSKQKQRKKNKKQSYQQGHILSCDSYTGSLTLPLAIPLGGSLVSSL